jgi:hypothetical protein
MPLKHTKKQGCPPPNNFSRTPREQWLTLQYHKATVHFAAITWDYLCVAFPQDRSIYAPRTSCFKQKQTKPQGHRTMAVELRDHTHITHCRQHQSQRQSYTVSVKRCSWEHLYLAVNTRTRKIVQWEVPQFVFFTIIIRKIKSDMVWWVGSVACMGHIINT